jgi:hypothetical protein
VRSPQPHAQKPQGSRALANQRLLGVLADVLQDALDHRAVLDHRDEPHPPATARTCQRVAPTHAIQQRRAAPRRQHPLLNRRDSRGTTARLRGVALDIAALDSAADVALVDVTARDIAARDDGADVARASAAPTSSPAVVVVGVWFLL